MVRSLPILTPLRGIAALIVVLFHARLILFPQWQPLLASQTQFIENGYVWVDLFFILSGFVMLHVYREQFARPCTFSQWRHFVWLRFSRIYPLFFITFVVLLIWELVKYHHQIGFYGGMLLESWGLKDIPAFSGPFNRADAILPNILLLQGLTESMLSWNISSWSLSIEWLCYLIFPLIVPLLNRSAKKTLWLPGLVLLVIYGLIEHKGNLDITGGVGAFLRGMCGFVLGIWLASLPLSARVQRHLNRDWVLVVLLGCIALVLHHSTSIPSLIAVYVLFAALVITGARQTPRNSVGFRLLNNRVTQYLGDISYSMYLWHTVLLLIGIEALQQLAPDLLTWWYAQQSIVLAVMAIGLFLVLTFSVSTVSYHCIERPAMKMLRKQTLSEPVIRSSPAE